MGYGFKNRIWDMGFKLSTGYGFKIEYEIWAQNLWN
jgi:hypothetical protein